MSAPGATVVDLFSGAGGLSLGFHAAGARLLAAVDASEMAGKTLKQNFARLQHGAEPVVCHGEAGNLETLDLERVVARGHGPDILVGGPPCQGFSRVGRAKLRSLAEDPESEDPRNALYQRFLLAASFWKPRAVLMENVVGMLSLRGQNVAELIAADLASRGYRVGYVLLNAVWFGVPQYRERLFFIGLREDLGLLPSAPDPTHLAELPSGYLRAREGLNLSFDFAGRFELAIRPGRASLPATTVGDALDDLPPILDHLSPGSRRLRTEDLHVLQPHERAATAPFARLMRKWPGFPVATGVQEHAIRRTPRDFETFRRMRPDDRYPEAIAIARARFAEELDRQTAAGTAPVRGSEAFEELEKEFVPPYPEDRFVDKWRKLNPGRPSWTLPAHLSRDSYSHIHHDDAQARAISVREAARLQSFPDAFEFCGNMGDCFTQIGNAVPPVLAWALANHILGLLRAPTVPCPLATPGSTPRRG